MKINVKPECFFYYKENIEFLNSIYNVIVVLTLIPHGGVFLCWVWVLALSLFGFTPGAFRQSSKNMRVMWLCLTIDDHSLSSIVDAENFFCFCF